MKTYIPHYYEYQSEDWDTFVELANAVTVDVGTGEKTIVFDTNKFRREGDFIISNDEDRLHLCLSDDELIRIPEGVKAIAPGAFYVDLCPNVKHIILSYTLVGIAQNAISGCPVEELTINNKYIYISDRAFDWCSSLRTIHHVPERGTIHVHKDMGRWSRPVKFERMSSYEPEDDCNNDLPF